MCYPDHRSFRHRRMSYRDVFEINRADPFTTRFDHVFRAIRNPHKAMRIDRGDVAGVEPARFCVGIVYLVEFVVVGANPRPANFQRAECNAVPRQFIAIVVGNLQFDAGHRATRALQMMLERVAFEFRRFHRVVVDRSKRTRFRHTPGVDHLDAVVVAKILHHR